MKLNIRTKPKKRLPSRNPQPLAQPQSANCCWSLDFMHDSLITGRPFRIFHAIGYQPGVAGHRNRHFVTNGARDRTLEQIADWRGYPEYVRVETVPNSSQQAGRLGGKSKQCDNPFHRPGKPAQNAYIERFNRTYREDVLDLYLFRTLTEVRELSSEWSYEYNGERPHESLNNMTPYEYLQTLT